MTAIVFGSPEAKAILAKNKELERMTEEEIKANSPEVLAERLRDIQDDIRATEEELHRLEHERDEIRAKLADAGGRPGRK